MNEFKRHLWYILPGTIVLFPLYFLIEGRFKIDSPYFLGVFLLLAFIAGVVIHQIYRACYHRLIFLNRPQVKLFIEKVNSEYFKKKTKFRLSISKDKKIVDPLYTLLINGNKKYDSFCKRMDNRSFYINFLGTLGLAFLFNLFISTVISLFLLANHQNCIIFIFIIWKLVLVGGIILLLGYLFTVNLKLKNSSEVAFISLKYKEFLCRKKETTGYYTTKDMEDTVEKLRSQY